jgi:hypothetical protein
MTRVRLVVLAGFLVGLRLVVVVLRIHRVTSCEAQTAGRGRPFHLSRTGVGAPR